MKPKLITPILIILSSVVVGLYAYLGSYSQLMADDFCSVHFVEKLGILKSVWYWYITWHGGYSASFADSLLGLLGRSGIGFIVPLTISIWFIALAWSIATLLKPLQFHWRGAVAVSAALLILHGTLTLSPNTSASIIWWGGLRGYVPPLIILPVYIALYLLYSRKDWPTWSRYLWYLTSFLLVLISGGFSEPFTPLQVLILFLILAGELYVDRNMLKGSKLLFLLSGLIGAIVALVLVVIAPGNANRQTFYPAPPPLLEMVMIAARSYQSLVIGFFQEPHKIATVLGVLSGGMLLGTFMMETRTFRFRYALIALGLGFFFAYCCFLPAAYGQSTGPSDTSLLIPVYILMITLVSAGAMSAVVIADTLPPTRLRLTITLSLIFFVALGYSTIVNARRLTAEIALAAEYTENWVIRDQQIKAAKSAGQEEVFVPAIPRWITQEPNDNPKFFVNECMSLYYDIKIISAANANE